MATEIKIPKKLIEVALPLDAINFASAHEKQPGIGAHPRGLHLWWARRPLATVRAVIFAQMVNDPGFERSLGRGVKKEDAKKERERLFRILEKLVLWENSNNEDLLKEAREEIWKSWRETCSLNKEHPLARELFDPTKLPAFHDPFAGGGAIPLEAQRLGLETYATDLNPVAVAINKAMIEIPSIFSGNKPVGPRLAREKNAKLIEEWGGTSGLAEDVLRYGAWIQEEAIRRIGHLYPPVEITSELVKIRPDLKPLIGQKFKVLTWIWARTVKSPNPAFSHVEVPLVSTFVLSTKEKRAAYVEPVINGEGYEFRVRLGKAPQDLVDGTVERSGGRCIISSAPIPFKHIRDEGKAGRLGTRLMAIVVEGPKGRLYIDPINVHEQVAKSLSPDWSPDGDICHWPGRTNVVEYGMTSFKHLFTSRQLVGLSTFCNLVGEAVKKCEADAAHNGLAADGIGLEKNGRGATAYSQAIAVYLAFAIDRLVDYGSTIATWKPSGEQVMQTFKRQAIPMTWDFPESNLLGEKAICWSKAVEYAAENLLATSPIMTVAKGFASLADAQTQSISSRRVVSTDPPYYDNIDYAGLSDYFYVWLRKTIGFVFTELFSENAVPKQEELVANPYRHGGVQNAQAFFLSGMKAAMIRIAEQAHPAFPVTIYYAFKQSETKDSVGTSSTGWEAFLEAVLSAGLSISGTWPMRTELGNRMIGSGSNALASSVVLVCNRRDPTAQTISRREFIRELNAALPEAMAEMTTGGEHSPVAPVDLSQAIIGPGMAIFSKYSAVLEADGKPMSVKVALQLINRFFAEDDFDHDTQFCLSWFEGHGWDQGKFGEADVLARAKGTSVDGLRSGGVIESGAGNLRLLRTDELPSDWSPETDTRLSVWEILHHLIRRFNLDGESGAGEILAKSGQYAENIRALAYRLYTLCERKHWAQDAGQYNSLVLAWEAIESSARTTGYTGSQFSLFGEDSEDHAPKAKLSKKKRKTL